ITSCLSRRRYKQAVWAGVLHNGFDLHCFPRTLRFHNTCYKTGGEDGREVALLMSKETFRGCGGDYRADLQWTRVTETITVVRYLPSLALIVVFAKSRGAKM
ncbi:hypothetical protein KUCAC02_031686, partial [Chaenocephalus aceratus]